MLILTLLEFQLVVGQKLIKLIQEKQSQRLRESLLQRREFVRFSLNSLRSYMGLIEIWIGFQINIKSSTPTLISANGECSLNRAAIPAIVSKKAIDQLLYRVSVYNIPGNSSKKSCRNISQVVKLKKLVLLFPNV